MIIFCILILFFIFNYFKYTFKNINVGFFNILIFFIIQILCLNKINSKDFTVVIDAGHGGSDYGAYGYGGYEKDLTLSISKKLGYYIEKHSFLNSKVVYTRNSDKFVPLFERVKIANSNHANLFISIHCNSTKTEFPQGTETYVLKCYKNQENFNFLRKNIPTYFEDDNGKIYSINNLNNQSYMIRSTLMENSYIINSIEFAKKVEKQFELIGRISRGVKQAGFLVIKKTIMPSVLIETGFISNKTEGMYLADPNGQNELAKAIYRAFCEFKYEYDHKKS